MPAADAGAVLTRQPDSAAAPHLDHQSAGHPITATLLIFLYRQDTNCRAMKQIAAQRNEKTAIHLIQLMNRQIAELTLPPPPDSIHRPCAENPGHQPIPNAHPGHGFREHDILKLKLYNPSAITSLLVESRTISAEPAGIRNAAESSGKRDAAPAGIPRYVPHLVRRCP